MNRDFSEGYENQRCAEASKMSAIGSEGKSTLELHVKQSFKTVVFGLRLAGLSGAVEKLMEARRAVNMQQTTWKVVPL